MKKFFVPLIYFFLISVNYAQQDLLPAYPEEISYQGDIAYYNGSPFTGVLVEKETNEKIGEFRNGYKNGIFIEYYDNKQKKSSYTYNNGNIIDGKYFIYSESGQVEKEETYKGGKLISYGEYEDGNLMALLELSMEYYINGNKKSEGYLENGEKTMKWISWYEQGQKKSEIDYKNGILFGPLKTWFEDGNIEMEGGYAKGQKDGFWISWYKEGQKKSEGYYQDGKEEGKWNTWFKNGVKEFEGNYKNGMKEGYGTLSLANGRGTYKVVWIKGKMNGNGSYTIYGPSFHFRYLGSFVNDKYEGQGTIDIKSGNENMSFTGEFKNGKYFNGILNTNTSKGNKYITEYKDGIEGEKTEIK